MTDGLNGEMRCRCHYLEAFECGTKSRKNDELKVLLVYMCLYYVVQDVYSEIMTTCIVEDEEESNPQQTNW